MNRRQRHDTEKHGREKTRILFCIRGANLNLSFNKHCAQQKPRTRTVNPSTRSAHKKHGFQLQTCKSVFAYMLNILSWFSSIISEITDIFMLFHNSKCQKAKMSNNFYFIFKPSDFSKVPHKSEKFYFPEAEFKEFERRFKFKPRFKYGWFHFKLFQMFQDLSRRLI